MKSLRFHFIPVRHRSGAFASMLCLILASGMCVGMFLQTTAAAKEPRKGKNAAQAALPPEGQELDVKAAELTKVTYQGPAQVQAFTQVGPKRWRSAAFFYHEVERDEFSVYLTRVKADNERVQIDLHTRKVNFFGNGPDQSYPLLSASSGGPK